LRTNKMDPMYVVHNPLAYLARESPTTAIDLMKDLPAAADDYSLVPDAVPSQNTSPGSASDHMGTLPDLPTSSMGAAGIRSSASLTAPSWQLALETNVPRVVSTFVSDPDIVRSWNTASPVTQDLIGNSNDSIAVASSGSSSPQSAATNPKSASAHRRKQAAKPKREPDGTTHRRQKRLERNRESAKLSRRRRKQYLEVLEERVTQFSHDLDRGRRDHVSKAVATIQQARHEILENNVMSPSSVATTLLNGPLSRTSQEFSIMTTFLSQQLKSFNLPPSMSFILWLTLQSETYFRGGRAQSERLSAARIGERVSTLALLINLLDMPYAMVLTN
jgi:hypothetical protein